MFAPGEFLGHPAYGSNELSTITAELLRQQVEPGNQISDLTPLTNLIQGIVSVRPGVGQRGTEQGLG